MRRSIYSHSCVIVVECGRVFNWHTTTPIWGGSTPIMSMYQTGSIMTSIQDHLKLYASGLWACPKTGMLLVLEESPLTWEQVDAMEHDCLDAYNEWSEHCSNLFAA